MGILSEIAHAGKGDEEYFIDFEDERCLDIGPFLIVGMLREEISRSTCRGGKLSRGVAKVLRAVRMAEFLKMRFQSSSDNPVYPYPLNRHSAVRRYNQGFETHQSAKEKQTRRFAESMNGWLRAAGMELSPDGGNYVRSMIAEILDNTRHANPHGDDGEWAIAGFMERRESEGENSIYVCHVAIVSIGLTISDSLEACKDPEVRSQIDAYIGEHAPASTRYSEATLRTVCALTDRVSCEGTRQDRDLGGCGMSSLVTMLRAIGAHLPDGAEPRITIVSGHSCIQLWDPYNAMLRSMGNEEGLHFQAFNEEQDLQRPPDDRYVYDLFERFPGTVIAVRFSIEPVELAKRIAAHQIRGDGREPGMDAPAPGG